MQEFKNLKELIAYFSDEKKCLAYLEKQLWNGKPVCPHCGSKRVYRLADGKKFKCGNKKTCDRKFTILVGTIYENTKLPLSIWFAAIYLCTAHKKGVSSHQLARDLGVTQKTAWFILHRIREMIKAHKVKLQDVVQADEVFVGGLNKNRHADKKIENSTGRSFKGKIPVLGVMQENGVVNTAVIPNTQAVTIKPIIQEMVQAGSILVTDDWDSYKSLSKEYFHIIIDHSTGEYVRGAFSTNRIEGFWSFLNRSLYGIYHCVSPKHLQRYCDENAYRYNSRKLKDADRFTLTVQESWGRLKYADLIKKEVNCRHGESQENEEKDHQKGEADQTGYDL